MLTEREHLEAWMCNQAVIDLRPGGVFELSGDYVYRRGGDQRIVALEPGRLVTFRWPFDDYDVTVTWRLESHLDMTRVIIEHDMSLDDAKVFLRKRFAQPLDRTLRNSLEETYRHDMFAYLELGFAPARASSNPEFPDNLVLELTLPGVSGTQAVAALTEPDHLDAWFEMQEFISWSTYVAADGENTKGEDNVDPHGRLIAVLLENTKDDDEGSLITIRESQTDDGASATIRFKESKFLSEKSFFGVYHGWRLYMVLLALYLTKGYSADRSVWTEIPSSTA